jgi:hypothetical protein
VLTIGNDISPIVGCQPLLGSRVLSLMGEERASAKRV